MGFVKSLFDGIMYMLTSLLMIPVIGYKLVASNKSESINASSAVDDMMNVYNSMSEMAEKINTVTTEATKTSGGGKFDGVKVD